MNMYGIKYKDSFTYIDKPECESENDVYMRLWFIAKNLHKYSFEDLLTYSKYYVNIKKYNLLYTEQIHTQISEMI
jgi:hypothetical protein